MNLKAFVNQMITHIEIVGNKQFDNVNRGGVNRKINVCADCEKQFVRKAQNYGKTNHGFCSHIDACA